MFRHSVTYNSSQFHGFRGREGLGVGVVSAQERENPRNPFADLVKVASGDAFGEGWHFFFREGVRTYRTSTDIVLLTRSRSSLPL